MSSTDNENSLTKREADLAAREAAVAEREADVEDFENFVEQGLTGFSEGIKNGFGIAAVGLCALNFGVVRTAFGACAITLLACGVKKLVNKFTHQRNIRDRPAP